MLRQCIYSIFICVIIQPITIYNYSMRYKWFCLKYYTIQPTEVLAYAYYGYEKLYADIVINKYINVQLGTVGLFLPGKIPWYHGWPICTLNRRES